jgi:hypothetical protein
MRKMKRLLLVAVALAMLAGLSTAAQALSFQTEPILGTDYSSITGDVVMITGPTPIDPGTGLPYRDVDNNIVLGPTIPHYSISGDPLEGVGSPSMTVFGIYPFTVGTGGNLGHMVDLNTFVYSGSGVNLDPCTVSYTGVYTFNPGGTGTYDVVAAAANGVSFLDEYDNWESFIMLNTGVGQFWLEDAGLWRYTETWWTDATSITKVRDFELKVVPEPMSIMLGIMGLASVAGFRRLRGK